MPILYVYDHCPFCVRARLALGLKGVKHDARGGVAQKADGARRLPRRAPRPLFQVRFMANDDVNLPTSMAPARA